MRGVGSKRKAVVERFYHDLWNKADKSHIGLILEPDFKYRAPLGPVLNGHVEFAGYVDDVLSAVSGFTCEILDMVEEGNSVAASIRFSGTHSGTMFDIAPTNRHVEWVGAAFFTFSGDRVQEIWVAGEIHALIGQMTDNEAFQG